jgi:hypothetical protein
VRLIRIFRVFKVSRYLPWVRVFINALTLSIQPLLMLVFVVLIAMVVFASAIYYAERGEWSEADGAFMRQHGGELEVSPYQSIPESFWWCIVTMTTVGYGDVYPVTGWGRFVAACTSLSGLLVLAIPITVISTNFNGEYAKLTKQREALRARMALLRRHFKERKVGLDAVLDEVEDLVSRNTQEFQSQVETLFDSARGELTEHLQEIVRMAFERRRQLHVAALAAGRVMGAMDPKALQLASARPAALAQGSGTAASATAGAAAGGAGLGTPPATPARVPSESGAISARRNGSSSSSVGRAPAAPAAIAAARSGSSAGTGGTGLRIGVAGSGTGGGGGGGEGIELPLRPAPGMAPSTGGTPRR